MKESQSNSLVGSLGWKLLERFGVQGIQFALQILLARLLSPDHYGVLSIMIIFTNLANVFIQTGFNTALVQNKDVTEEDYSSVFWVSLSVAAIFYAAIFFCAPLIASFYQMPDIIWPLRVLALMLLPGALNSVQLAKVSREMNFRKVFYSNIAGILLAGGASIGLALLGGGLWALVAYTMINVFVACIVMRFTCNWKIRLVCNFKRIKVLFAFGWKLLVSGLLETLFQESRSLVIGKKYDSGTLGYYNRGKQFPQFFITAVSSTVQSVMLPAMSREQSEQDKIKTLTRNSIMLGAFLLFPIMAILAGVATPLVQFLLADKWLPCVPYLQIYCFSLAFNPIHMCNLQAINAMGRSDIFLKLEIVKKAIGISALVVAVFCFDSPIYIALTGVFTTFTSCIINAYPNKRLIQYTYLEQMKDILPSFAMSVVMLVGVLLLGQLPLAPVLLLMLQAAAGLAIYLILSLIFRPQPFCFLLDGLKYKFRTR